MKSCRPTPQVTGSFPPSSPFESRKMDRKSKFPLACCTRVSNTTPLNMFCHEILFNIVRAPCQLSPCLRCFSNSQLPRIEYPELFHLQIEPFPRDPTPPAVIRSPPCGLKTHPMVFLGPCLPLEKKIPTSFLSFSSFLLYTSPEIAARRRRQRVDFRSGGRWLLLYSPYTSLPPDLNPPYFWLRFPGSLLSLSGG